MIDYPENQCAAGFAVRKLQLRIVGFAISVPWSVCSLPQGIVLLYPRVYGIANQLISTATRPFRKLLI